MLRNQALKLLHDESGAEVIEFALIAGLIVIAAVALISTVGAKLLARWSTLSQAL